MNISLKIAKAELMSLFYSPIAWFLTIIFIFQSALTYTSLLEEVLTKQQLGGNYSLGLGYLTNNIFGVYGLFGGMARKIFLYLPLLTMGLISRETSSGTIKLLYSSPIKVKQIVWGKFIAMIAYSLILTAVLAIFVLTSNYVIHAAGTGAMWSGLLGIFLLLCTYSAIGLFMSCLTTYQVVAALSTLVVFAILNYIGTVWQSIDLIRGLTYFLSMTGRTDRMIVGLISSKDVVYFLVIIAMFLGFSIIKLQGERKSKPPMRNALNYTLVFALSLLVGYCCSIPRLIISYDTTAIKVFTLHPNTRKIIDELDAPLEVITYINLLDQYIWEGLPNVRNRDLDRWEPYLRAKHDVSLKYVYYYDYPGAEQELMSSNPGKTLKQIAENAAKSHNLDIEDFKTPAEIRKIIDLRTENNSYVIQLKYKNKQTFLRLYSDELMFPSETEVSAAVKRLTMPLPKIVFVESEFERGRNPKGERDYGVLTNGMRNRISLINQGFDTESISLNDQEIPLGITALVIADPKSAFSPQAKIKIENYIKAGGNLLITGDPGKRDIVNMITEPLGVSLMKGQLVEDNSLRKGKKHQDVQEPSEGTVGIVRSGDGTIVNGMNNGQMPDLIHVSMTKNVLGMSKYFTKPFENKLAVTMKGTSSLSYQNTSGFNIAPLLVTDQDVSWLKMGKLNADSLKISYASTDGDIKGSFPTLVALTRKAAGKDQKIIISGNADFLSNAGIYRPLDQRQANLQLGIGLFSWFSNGQFPVDTEKAPMQDKSLNLTSGELKFMRIVYMGLLPGLLILVGTIFLFRRKRR